MAKSLLTILTAILPCLSVLAVDSFQADLSQAHPGSVIHLSGSHTGKFVTSVKGTADAPITIEGDGTAVLVGSDRGEPVLHIKHSYYRIRNISVQQGPERHPGQSRVARNS